MTVVGLDGPRGNKQSGSLPPAWSLLAWQSSTPAAQSSLGNKALSAAQAAPLAIKHYLGPGRPRPQDLCEGSLSAAPRALTHLRRTDDLPVPMLRSGPLTIPLHLLLLLPRGLLCHLQAHAVTGHWCAFWVHAIHAAHQAPGSHILQTGASPAD